MVRFTYILSMRNNYNLIKKGAILQRAGELSKRVYIIKEGLLRSYIIDQQGKEHTFMFAPEGWLLADPETNVNNRATELFVEALEESLVKVVHDPLAISLSSPVEEIQIALTRTLKRMAVLQRRVLLLMSASVIDRYHDFIRTYPDIMDRVPQHMIASYLGVTPEALSKVKREFEKNMSS